MAAQGTDGYSLVEVLLVVALLSIVAAIAAPAFFEDTEATLDEATAEVVGAFRFAHTEAVRTGVAHGVNARIFGDTIRVYRVDETTSPGSATYDVVHPLTKQVYELDLDSEVFEPTLSAVYIKFKGALFPTSYLTFDGGSGVPKYRLFGNVYLLDTAYVRISHDGVTREVQISPITGRVTVQ